MNAAEIEEAVSELAEAPFDPEAFPYPFLETFGDKETTLQWVKTGNTKAERLDKLFELYTQIAAREGSTKATKKPAWQRKKV
jgi:hypothetical protein